MSPPSHLIITLPNNPAITLDTVVSNPPSRSATGSFPTLLCLHFWGGTKRTYYPTFKRLCTDFDIIAPTLRGWGESSRPQDAKAYSIRQNADDIADLVRFFQASGQYESILRNGIVIVGHSMGAKIAQLLLTYRDLQPLIRGLVLIAPAPASPLHFSAEMKAQQRTAYSSLEIVRGVIQHTLLGRPDVFQKTGGGAGESKEIEVLAEDAFSGSHGAKSAWPEYGMSEDCSAAVRDAIQAQNAAGKQVKALVVVSQLDRIETPDKVRATVSGPLEQAGASVVVEEVADAGHLIPMEAPKQLTRHITQFVREQIVGGEKGGDDMAPEAEYARYFDFEGSES